ncbi:hypothetical protein XENOCAPTIV_017179 [Xenoophorus captivus]|uniref:WW domain-containing protein n=1 Tax=Xenoophorus captivus TaxID=1517983 RepID=A0ABV0QVS0_9TELE
MESVRNFEQWQSQRSQLQGAMHQFNQRYLYSVRNFSLHQFLCTSTCLFSLFSLFLQLSVLTCMFLSNKLFVLHLILNLFWIKFQHLSVIGVRYFVDHNTRTTTFSDPRTGKSSV